VSEGLGRRLSSGRRDRIAYTAMLRRSSRYNLRATGVRVAAVVVLAGCAAAVGDLLALALCLPAAAVAALQLLEQHHERTETLSRLRLVAAHQRSARRKSGQQSMPWTTWVEVAAGLLLVAIPCWLVVDAPAELRLVLLAAAGAHHSSTALAIFTDHAWFNPDEPDPPAWHEVTRLLAGPLTAGLVCLIALPAPWPPEAWLAALAISLAPLLVTLRIRNSDLTVSSLAELVREEGHAGRELVISETHGALSTHLRLLEQEARRFRHSAPTLYELAVSANSRLRETLTLGRIGQESSTSPASLAAPVLTLARAVGAAVTVDIDVDQMAGRDRDLARLVLSDLVGNAVNAGAGLIGVTVTRKASDLVIQVRDDAPPMPPSVWKEPGTSSARLESRLAERAGSLTYQQGEQTKLVVARWAVQVGEAEVEDDDDDRAGAAG
jgi:signal transduction histidine kinase